jgi:hypothetical protein
MSTGPSATLRLAVTTSSTGAATDTLVEFKSSRSNIAADDRQLTPGGA